MLLLMALMNMLTKLLTLHHVMLWAWGSIKALSDALAKIGALEQELKLLKQELIVAKDKSTLYQKKKS